MFFYELLIITKKINYFIFVRININLFINYKNNIFICYIFVYKLIKHFNNLCFNNIINFHISFSNISILLFNDTIVNLTDNVCPIYYNNVFTIFKHM